MVLMGDREEQSNTMLTGDKKCREKMIGDDLGLWTVECLRGRLLAERLASRAAKEDAELMGNKLIELEKQLRLAVKSRNKAEKKLKFLMKKMESMNLSPVQDKSSSFDTKDSSSSSTASSGINALGEQKHVPQMEELVKCDTEEEMGETIDSSLTSGDLRNNNSVRSIVNIDCQTPSIGSCDGTAHSCEIGDDTYSKETSNTENSPSEMSITDDDLRQAFTSEKEFSGENNQVQYADDMLALVPTNVKPTCCEPRINHHNIYDVLADLRYAKQRLQNSMGRTNVNNSRLFVSCTGV